MSENTVIHKSTIVSYKIRKKGRDHAWADISLDMGKECVRVQIASDYGDWQNFWSHCGCHPAKFLNKIDIHYAASKFHAHRELDEEKTIKGIKESIIESRRMGSITAEYARELWECLSELDYNDKESFGHAAWNSELSNYYQDEMPIYDKVDSGFERFWDELWKPFTEQLLKDYESELIQTT